MPALQRELIAAAGCHRMGLRHDVDGVDNDETEVITEQLGIVGWRRGGILHDALEGLVADAAHAIGPVRALRRAGLQV